MRTSSGIASKAFAGVRLIFIDALIDQSISIGSSFAIEPLFRKQTLERRHLKNLWRGAMLMTPSEDSTR